MFESLSLVQMLAAGLSPAVLMLLVSGIKRYVAPIIDHLPPKPQRVFVATIGAAMIATLAELGVVLPEGVGAISPEALTLLWYTVLGALGLHSVKKNP